MQPTRGTRRHPTTSDRTMKSLWNDTEAAGYQGDLALRVYTSRLLGREPALVLHGGGNTSVKIRERNILGAEEDLLYVKGSGWDLETIEAAGFPPVRLDHLRALARLPALGDVEMVNELRTHMTIASAPTPSVEAILHAIIPHRYVDHTHADAVIALTNNGAGEARTREVFGDDCVIIPYVMPGFDLARLCAERFAAQANEHTIGMVLLNHGIFSFGATARESYERMIALVSRAEDYLKKHAAWELDFPAQSAPTNAQRQEIAALRLEASRVAGFALLLSCHQDERSLAFARRDDVASIGARGPATPDHVIRTKRVPMIGRNIPQYIAEYKEYFQQHEPNARDRKTMLDPAPRVILDPALGVCTLGRSARDADIVADIYAHTIEVILRAQALGGYQALPASDIFDVEYWDLEQAKLRQAGKPAVFAGEVALVTGTASGIGLACARSLLARGAAVIGLDIAPSIATALKHPAWLGLPCDITDEAALIQALETGVRRFGGLDMLVLNAGMFPPGKRIDALDSATWHKVLTVNLDANLVLMREAHPLLKQAPNGARVVAIGSRNVTAPGPGAAAYSASKAALNQLIRVAALEWGQDGIRVNTVHPDAVFDTGIWTPEVLAARAAHYGLTVEQYKTRNVLRREVESRHVAELVAELCGPLFARTTGAQIPIDGGSDRVI
jgi:rhamnose utilization protein RhaD (predicted bifunctional aldolase and dehydrogenase)/NAD(P)-dependent dehydrogenase (short-subunit alcohol dehydrogenase family)